MSESVVQWGLESGLFPFQTSFYWSWNKLSQITQTPTYSISHKLLQKQCKSTLYFSIFGIFVALQLGKSVCKRNTVSTAYLLAEVLFHSSPCERAVRQAVRNRVNLKMSDLMPSKTASTLKCENRFSYYLSFTHVLLHLF